MWFPSGTFSGTILANETRIQWKLYIKNSVTHLRSDCVKKKFNLIAHLNIKSEIATNVNNNHTHFINSLMICMQMTTFCAYFDFISQEKSIKSKTRSFIIATLHVANIRSFADCQSRFVIDGTRSQCFCFHSLRSVRIVPFFFIYLLFFYSKQNLILSLSERRGTEGIGGDYTPIIIMKKKQFIFCSFFS